MWFHSEDQGYALANVGVAVSNTVTGPYRFLASWRPLGRESRDMSVFVDDDGTGYLTFATDGNANFAIAKLTSDYRNVSSIVYQFNNVRYEGSGILKRNGVYSLIVSHQSGWAPNDDLVLTASSLAGPWSSPSNIAPSGLNTYDSQNNFDLPIAGSSQTSYIYMGDRWRVDYLGLSTYVWYPFDVANGKIVKQDAWRVDPSTGAISTPQASGVINAIDAVRGSTTRTNSCSACPSGTIVTYIGNGAPAGSVTFNNLASPSGGSGGKVLVSIYYTNQDGYPTYRQFNVRVGGAAPQLVEAAPGGAPNTGLQSVPVEVTFASGSSNSITISNANGYAPDISHIVLYQL